MFRMRTFVLSAAVLVCAAVAFSQGQRKRASPHETITAELAGKPITITYGRPYVKGRQIFGELVPYGKVWRTGADEATELTTEATLDIGGLKVPAGSYSLYTLPGENEWKLIVNKAAGQWGTQYDESKDLGRVDMKVTKAEPTEQLSIVIDKTGANSGVLKISWENVQASVPISAK